MNEIKINIEEVRESGNAVRGPYTVPVIQGHCNGNATVRMPGGGAAVAEKDGGARLTVYVREDGQPIEAREEVER